MAATARKVAVLFYNAVRHGMEYIDPGASSYETRFVGIKKLALAADATHAEASKSHDAVWEGY